MKKILVGGVFNILHPGHLHFLKKAKSYGDYLVVVLANDKITKKTKNFAIPQENRLEVIKSLRFVDDAVIGDENTPSKSVMSLDPDIIVLGHDQKLPFSEKELKDIEKKLNKKIEIIKLEEKDHLKKKFCKTTDIIRYIQKLGKEQ